MRYAVRSRRNVVLKEINGKIDEVVRPNRRKVARLKLPRVRRDLIGDEYVNEIARRVYY